MKKTFILRAKNLLSVFAIALLLTIVGNRALAVVPTITSITPVSGLPVTGTVVITGTGFNDTASRNIVWFGGVQASVTTASAASLLVVVPLGAQYSNVTVLNLTTRLTAVSSGIFAPDYDNSCFIPGTNTFKTRVDFSINGTSSPGPYTAAIGDIDGDGKPDVVVCTYQAIPPPTGGGQGLLYIYRNIGAQGEFNYAPAVLCTTVNGCTNVKLADLDGDGKLDIIVAATGSGRFACSRNMSTPGSIVIAPKYQNHFSHGSPDIAIADFDGDGKLDIAGAAYPDDSVQIFHNIISSIPVAAFTSGGTFTSYYVGFPVGTTPLSLCSGDLDGDGKPDIITANSTDGTISVLRNISIVDSFMFEPKVDYAVGTDPRYVRVMEINGDNRPEIVVTNFGSDNITIFQNNVTTTPFTGSSLSTGIILSTGAGTTPAAFATGDFDGDGKADLAVTTAGTNSLSIFKNTYASGAINSATFTPGNIYTTGAGSGPAGISVGDMDGDNKPDVVTGNIGNNTISIFKNTSTPDTNSIRGIDTLCVASAMTLASQHCTNGSAYWSVSNANATIVGGAGGLDSNAVITGVTAGYDTVTMAVVSLFDTNYVHFIVKILPVADTGIISGPTNVCVNATISLSETVTGGTWSSSNTAIANVTATGVVSGVGAGNATIFYTANSLSCGPLSASHPVTVNALPDAGTITGANGVCTSSSITLTASLPGGIWGNKYPALALTVPSGATNVITGLVVGADTILYVATTALCGSDTAFHAVGVVATGISLPISGPDSVCQAATITLSNGATGGTWASNSTAIATVNAVTGVVTGVATGTTTISYTVNYGCGPVVATKSVTVKAIPNAGTIVGLDSVCSGAQISLTNPTAAAGGVWSSASNTIATVTTAGVVTGVSAVLATTNITYTSSTFSCGTLTANHAVTVKALPNAGTITGLDSVCSLAQITLTTSGTPGGVWGSVAPAIATVTSAGVVTGLSTTLATTTINYTALTFSCGSATTTLSVTVKPLPNAGAIVGLDSVCSGAQISLTNPTAAAGGVWSSASNTIATVTAAGVVTGVSAVLATTNITYTSSTFSCGTLTANHAVTVKALPNAGTITGLDSVCSLAQITLTNSGTPGGVWGSVAPAIATVTSAGLVTGLSTTLATTTINYTASTFSCGSATTTLSVTVKPLPNAGAIVGLDSVCSGAQITLTNPTAAAGGVWSSASNPIATVTATGVVTGVSAALATTNIIYTSSTFSCGTLTANHSVTVKALPNAGTITGLDSVCSLAQITLTTSGTPGGVWGSVAPAIATVTSAGVVTGLSTTLATTTINYTSNTFSCGSNSTTHLVTVKPLPNAGSISGPSSVCSGATISLSDPAPGGVWSSTSTAVATVTATGVVGGASPTLATTNILYTVPTFSCGSASATQAVTVNPLPNAGTISGLSSVCAGSLLTLTDGATGGTWSSTNTGAATISATGVAGGVAAGTTTISYTVTNVCGTVAATLPLTVNPLPVAGTITGTTTVCEGSLTALSDAAPGGTWNSQNTGIATIAGGSVGGVSAGVVLISYTVSNVCGTVFDTALVTVNPLPHAGTISGPVSVCEGSTISLASTIGGGTWSSTNTAMATVGATGIVSGVAAGSLNIQYSFSNSCGTDVSSYPFTVNPLPHAGTISGIPNLCPGTTTNLSSTTTGGTWISGNTAIATVTSGGVVGGVAAGSVNISYSFTNVCGTDISVFPAVVVPFPSAGTISGPSLVCPGTTISLSSTVLGGVWSSLNTAVVTVTSGTGIVGGVAAGTASIKYTVTNFCGVAFTTHSMTVNPIVVPSVTITLTPNDTICAGTLVTFTPTGVNGGPTPTFVWTIFGSPVDTANTLTYAPANFDYVACIMISSAPCPVPKADTSTGISMFVRPVVTPTISIVSSVPGDVISYLGQTVTFFSTVTYGGTNPTYQWYLNGVPVTGATSASYSTDVYTDDTVYCIMTSDVECATSPFDTSDVRIIRLGVLGIGDAIVMNDIIMYPNPNNGSFTVTGKTTSSANAEITYQVIDMMGRIVYTDHGTTRGEEIRQAIKMGDAIPPGNYILRVLNDSESKIIHFTLNN